MQKVNSPSLRILLDIFHLQHIQGNLTKSIQDIKNYIGHVQIAQVPERGEPDTPGEINFPYVFKLLDNVGYTGWIGLEYKPQEGTAQGLKWIKQFGFDL